MDSPSVIVTMIEAAQNFLLSSYEILMKWWSDKLVEIYQDSPTHVIGELFLIGAIIFLFLRKPKKQKKLLTPEEEEELIATWKPLPLAEEPTAIQKRRLDETLALEGPLKTVCTMGGKQMVDFSSYNFLDLIGDRTLEAAAIAEVDKYGCGTCGPRGFYGTLEPHLKIEECLADFVGSEAALLFTYSFATVSSAIPAFSKRGDQIVCDDGVCLATQTGVDLSRSKIKYFKHNDMEDLERTLQAVIENDKKNKRVVHRRFVVVDGLYTRHADLCPLPEVKALANKYKFRIILDESSSIGVIGRNGRGLTSFYGIDPKEIDVICGSLGQAFGSVGGFCCGSNEVVDHQRLSSKGYCFSASLPPLLAGPVIETLKSLEQDASCLEILSKNAQILRAGLDKIPGIIVTGTGGLPIMHVTLDRHFASQEDAENALRDICLMCRANGVLMIVPQYSPLEMETPAPSIRVTVGAGHSVTQIKLAVRTLERAVATYLRR
eukprot:TRINITY_DN2982_c0_g1_i1.p1 TRINITY_DN2982_c0_g1~~TRINITY_DN2982_c0_g1_i1.p1  ORF type:complete len:491 (-),score=145.10 TRINITY_DN2982_c0_g1_i1:3-1475(-)